MDIEHCKEFLLLAARLNFTETASELNMTQPALSKHVHALEKEFGAAFLDRSKHGLQLTEAGRIFSENAAAIVNSYEKTREAIAALQERPSLRIDGNFGDTDISSFISMVVLIAREEEHVGVSVSSGSREDCTRRLLDGEIDLYIGCVDPDDMDEAGLETRVFMENNLVAIVNANHRLAKRKSITLEDLRQETLLHCGSETIDMAWKRIEKALSDRGIKPRIRFVPCDTTIACFTTPLENSVLLWKASYREIGQLLATGSRASVPLEDDVTLKSYLVYRPDSTTKLEGFFRAVDKAREKLGSASKARRTIDLKDHS